MATTIHELSPDAEYNPVKISPVITFNHMEETIQNSEVALGAQMATRYLLTDVLLMTAMATVMILLFS